MDKYVCDLCGYIYDPANGDPDNGVAPGTPWEQVPADWVCPLCGAGKAQCAKEEASDMETRSGVQPGRVSFFRHGKGSLEKNNWFVKKISIHFFDN